MDGPKLETKSTTPEKEELLKKNFKAPLAQQVNAGCGSAQRLRTMDMLIQQYSSEGRDDLAVTLCKQMLEDQEKISGHDHPDVATILESLADIYRYQNKDDVCLLATNLLKDALSIREKTLGENHPTVAATLNSLAEVYEYSRMKSTAEPLRRRALCICEAALGRNHPDVAEQLCKLAWYCYVPNEDNYEDVEQCFQRALEIYERKFGPDDPKVAETNNKLGICYLNQNKYEEAEQCHQRAIEIYESKFGLDDRNVAYTKNELGICYLIEGKYKEAETLYKQMLTRAHEREFGIIDGDNRPIWQVAEECEENKHLQKEYALYKGAKMYDPMVITALANLGSLYHSQRKYRAAEMLEDCVKKLTAKTQPSGSPSATHGSPTETKPSDTSSQTQPSGSPSATHGSPSETQPSDTSSQTQPSASSSYTAPALSLSESSDEPADPAAEPASSAAPEPVAETIAAAGGSRASRSSRPGRDEHSPGGASELEQRRVAAEERVPDELAALAASNRAILETLQQLVGLLQTHLTKE